MPLLSPVPIGRSLRRWLLALAALGAVGALTAAKDTDATQLLFSELPPEVTLRSATPEQIYGATRRAVHRQPRQAVPVVRVAILGRVSPRRPVEGKNVVLDRSKETVCPPCEFVLGVVRAAIRGNAEQAGAIIEEAGSLCPSCEGALLALLADPGLALGGTEDDFTSGVFGFGLGLGPGFPGTPSFTGPTGGILSLPPVGGPVTAVTNL